MGEKEEFTAMMNDFLHSNPEKMRAWTNHIVEGIERSRMFLQFIQELEELKRKNDELTEEMLKARKWSLVQKQVNHHCIDAMKELHIRIDVIEKWIKSNKR